MSITRKGARSIALLAGSALALTACTSGGGGGEDEPAAGGGETSAETQPVTITFGYEQEFASYNNNTSAQNAVANTVVLNQVLRGFWEYGPDGSVQADEEFGTYERTSEDPLTVEYSINEDAVWSDGEQIDCDDMKLAAYAYKGTPSGETAEDGTELLLFDPAGTAGYEDIASVECADGDKDVTVTYARPFADWDSRFGQIEIMPAHVVERETGVEDIIVPIDADDTAAMAPVSEFWQTAWVFNPGELPDPALIPSSGPYVISEWQAGQSLTLTANPEWWGEPPLSETIVIRYIPQDQQAQALANNEIQVMNPQPNPELISQLEGLGDQITFNTGEEFTYEHLDFNFNTFFSDRNLREAFAKCVPRQTIVDNLIKPQNPEAVVQNSRWVFPFQDEYEAVVEGSYEGQYDEVDIAGAKELVDAAGAAGTEVRIGYRTPNPRRTNVVDLIRDSCGQAGFTITDIGSEDFFGNGLANGIFDVALFAWSGSPIVTGTSSTFQTNGGNNNGKYSNPQVDELVTQLNGEVDADAQTEIITEMETILWEDLATIPIFTFPSIEAHASTIEGVVLQPSQSQLTWNIQDWTQAQ